MKRRLLCLAFLSLIAVIAGMSSSPAFAGTVKAGRVAQSYATPMPTSPVTHTRVTKVIGVYSPLHSAPIVPIGAVTISRTTTPSGTLVVYQLHGLDYDVTYYPSGRYVYTEVRVAGAAAPTATVAAAATPAPTASASGATPVPATSSSTTASGGATTGSTASTPTYTASVVPAGAVEVSRSSTANGTLIVYHSGGLYYNVTYLPTGRYVYTVTQAPAATASTVTTLPTTGGAAPSAPVLPMLLGLALTVLGITARRVSRTGR